MQKEEHLKKQAKQLKRKGWMTIIGGTIMHLVFGTVYLWGGISVYISSYLIQFDQQASLENVSNIFPFMIVLINLASFIGIRINQKYKAQRILSICIVPLLASILLLSFIKNYLLFVFVYLIGFGISSGIMYLVPINTAFKYPIKKGYVTGVIIAGYGFGSFFFTLLSQQLVNHQNLKPDILYNDQKYFNTQIANRVPFMFRIIFGCYFLLLLVGMNMVKEPESKDLKNYKKYKEMKQQQKDNQILKENDESFKIESENKQQILIISQQQDKSGRLLSSVSYDIEPHKFDKRQEKPVKQQPLINKEEQRPEYQEIDSLYQGLFSFQFVLLFLIGISIMFNGMFIVNQYKNFGLTVKNLSDDQYLTIVGAVGSVANGSMRSVWAFTMEKIGFKRVFFIIISIQLIVSSSFYFITFSRFLYGLYVALSLACMGGFFSCFPAFVTRLFGQKVGTQIYSFVFISFGFSNLVPFFLISYQIQYFKCFIISAFLTLISIFLMLFVKDRYYILINKNNKKVEHEESLRVELNMQDNI